MNKALLAIALGSLLLAQQAVSPITADLRAEYWQARSDDADAQLAALKARTALTAVIDKLRKTCGNNQLIEGPDKQPTCAAPPPKETPK